jgi:hypothetical protein
MSRPTTRTELLERMTTEFADLMADADQIQPERRTGPSDYPRGSVKDMLAHLDAWQRMFLEWERVGRTGAVAEMPAPGHTWKTTPALNMEIHERCVGDSWEDVVAGLRESHGQVREVVASYAAGELFEKKRYKWTGSTSVGSYAVSATTSHYEWAANHLRKSRRAWAAGDAAATQPMGHRTK